MSQLRRQPGSQRLGGVQSFRYVVWKLLQSLLVSVISQVRHIPHRCWVDAVQSALMQKVCVPEELEIRNDEKELKSPVLMPEDAVEDSLESSPVVYLSLQVEGLSLEGEGLFG